MQRRDHDHRNRFNEPEHEPREGNATVLTNAAFAFAVCFFFASLFPRELVIASLSSLLFVVAFGATVTAVLCGESPFVPQLTSWDFAATFLLLSLILSWLVDPEAVRSAVEAQGGAALTRTS
ncbi:MAG: hypothetical protein ACE5KF_02635 [Kiloniellaceae bacterium]